MSGECQIDVGDGSLTRPRGRRRPSRAGVNARRSPLLQFTVDDPFVS
jgi:hypothetical protein